MTKTLLICSIMLLISAHTFSQSLRSIRYKLENELIDKVVDEVFDDGTNKSDQSPSTAGTSSDKPDQKSDDTGLNNSLADVPEALAQASTEFNATEYRDARASLRKALNTLEIKIGQQILASLPESVSGLPVEEGSDKVSSSSSSWTGLSIHREYKQKDSWAAITIYNGSMSGLANASIGSGAYATYSEDQENQKSVRVKGYDAVITFSSNEGYTLNISLGQQTFVLVEGVNVDSEARMMSIAESFDYASIQKSLGN